MPWGRLDDSLYDHPKLDLLGRYRLPCIGLNTLAQSWCNRWLTNGEIPADRVPRLGGTTAQADLLVTAGLWERTSDGYRIHDFLDYNDSREEVLAQRHAARERMRSVRRNKHNGSPEPKPNLTGSSPEVRDASPVPSTPDLSRSSRHVQRNVKTTRDPEIQRMLDLQEAALRERGVMPS